MAVTCELVEIGLVVAVSCRDETSERGRMEGSVETAETTDDPPRSDPIRADGDGTDTACPRLTGDGVEGKVPVGSDIL